MKLWKKKKKKKQGFSSGEKTPLHPQPMFGLFLEKGGEKRHGLVKAEHSKGCETSWREH